ncbi:MAG: DUF4382 domain-containing protein [Armatimonas sp.]
MTSKRNHFALCLTLSALGALALIGIGCSSGSTPGGSSSRAKTNVYVTDGPREDYAHVWATIYKVTLTPQDGTAAVTVFDSAEGVLIDLKTLRDASGERYSFLSSASVPAGTYTGANVTIGATMQLIKTGASTGTDLAVDSSIATDASGHPTVPITFRSPKTLGEGTASVVVDFNLARFVVKASGVLPALAEGQGDGLPNKQRHEEGEYRGTISSLSGTAPDLTFTLTTGSGQVVTVTTSASTALYGATLADGATVSIDGTVDATTGVLAATRVGVCGTGGPSANARTPRAGGTASNLDATAGTFTLTFERAQCLTPDATTLTVVTNSSTVFRADDGSTTDSATFFTALATTPNVQVEGTFDEATNTLTATEVRVFNPANDDKPQEFRGPHGRGGWGNGALQGHQ